MLKLLQPFLPWQKSWNFCHVTNTEFLKFCHDCLGNCNYHDFYLSLSWTCHGGLRIIDRATLTNMPWHFSNFVCLWYQYNFFHGKFFQLFFHGKNIFKTIPTPPKHCFSSSRDTNLPCHATHFCHVRIVTSFFPWKQSWNFCHVTNI